MNKDYLFLIGLLSLILAGCAKIEKTTFNDETDQIIDFSSYTGRSVTKAGNGSGFDFRIEAFLTGESPRKLYFSATKYHSYYPTQAVGYESEWTGEVTRYWPLDKSQNLDFYAVGPESYVNSDSKTIDLSPTTDSTVVITKTDGTADVRVSRVINAANAQRVKLPFTHTMTKVSFNAKGASNGHNYVVSELTVVANGSGTYSFGATGSWSESTGEDDVEYKYASSDVTINGSTAKQVGKTLYMIPSQDDSVKVILKYKVYEETTLVDDNSTGVELMLPTSAWGINKSLTYTLVLGISGKAQSVIIDSYTLAIWDTNSNSTIDVKSLPDYVVGTNNYGKGIQIGNVIWAPVNCGYDKDHPYGLLYQYGRAQGQGYAEASTSSYDETDAPQTSDIVNETTSNPDSAIFYYKKAGSYYSWFDGTPAVTTWPSWPSKEGDPGFIEGVIDDPCPDGWRLPTSAEISYLWSNNQSASTSTNDEGVKGYWLNGTTSSYKNYYAKDYWGVFFPLAGYRNGSTGKATGRQSCARYWTSRGWNSAAYTPGVYWVEFSTYGYTTTTNNTAHGASVRCVWIK